MIFDKELLGRKPEPIKELIPLCRKTAAEGSVLLKNENNLLPLKKDTKIAVFGRVQTFYYKSGTGSGGLVHIEKEPCILTSLRENSDLIIDEELAAEYKKWIIDNPFDNANNAWAKEPWCQEEMPLEEDAVKNAAVRNDAAVVIIGRTAGEDKDNSNTAGSFLLTEKEEDMLKKVTDCFKQVAVILNVGNIIDLSFMDKYPINALMYVWHGGMEGANALADLLSGKASPSGKLTDTQGFCIEDYPSYKNFGNREENIYEEDIYVGYRYFETFAKEKVRYPFGFGLTFTDFDINYSAKKENNQITVTADVTNNGKRQGREVIQVYYEAPCGSLGTPERQLVGFAKTKCLNVGETEKLTVSFPLEQMASYDDIGVTGNRSCYVLENGEYKIWAGTDVKKCDNILSFEISETVVTKQLEEIMPPVKSFKRIKAISKDNKRIESLVELPVGISNMEKRIAERRPETVEYTGNTGIILTDVYNGKNSLEEFVAQLSDVDLAAIVCGEGMDSPKATRGTVGAIGGLTESLKSFGVPVCCVSDGPSGLRMDTGAKASLLPNGTLLASTWDTELAEELYSLVGAEIFNYKVDCLLGPGINIHRDPLCGRNFEYFSEDPFLTGKMAAAVTKGVAHSGSFSTIKHFCCNNQEAYRKINDSVVSERALREIYLKGYEIAIKEGKNISIMTSYNLINGYHAPSNYDLNTTVLRKEWGYDGFVMTDWWANCNCFGEAGDKNNLKAMVRAQNDIYMVCPDTLSQPHNIMAGLEEGYVTRGELQRSASNLLRFIMHTPTFKRYIAGEDMSTEVKIDLENLTSVFEKTNVSPYRPFEAELDSAGEYVISISLISYADSLAQNRVTVFVDNELFAFSVNGETGEEIEKELKIKIKNNLPSISLEFPECIKCKKIGIYAEV